jgi:uroporphyrinogen-III synthase
VIAFTASPQVERLIAVARAAGLEKELSSGLARTRIAAIGPVVAETLKAHGFAAHIQPESNFHLKPLVRAIMGARRA